MVESEGFVVLDEQVESLSPGDTIPFLPFSEVLN
jgi:hypothetical protein